jgi:predicted secreted hydrolase
MTRASLLLAVALGVAAPSPSPPPGSSVSSVPGTSGFKLARAPYAFHFPRDHASHPDYRTEWWYYTGHVRGGRESFGYELTFFRVGLDLARRDSPSAWAPHTLHLVHLALTDENGRRFHSAEDVGRPALGMSGADTLTYRVWVHGDSAMLAPDGATHLLRAASDDFAFALTLRPLKPPVIHGRHGVSRKSAGDGRASHYYSLTRLATSGTLTYGGRTRPVEGESWMDHEFGSGALGTDQVGWDWFSLQLDDGRELMLYRLRLKDGRTEPFSSGTLVERDGSWRHLTLAAFTIESDARWRSAATGADYPAGWRVRVPSAGLDVTVTPTVSDQELVTRWTGVSYWEGSVRVSGRSSGRDVAGLGYVELTGYAGAVPGF